MKTLLLFGATGLVGGHVLRLALRDARVTRVIAPVRRPLPAEALADTATAASRRAELLAPVVDVDTLPAEADWWWADAAVCALGTTLKKAGSQAAFRRVDVDLVTETARLARRHGTPAFALNSSLGADAGARSFYLRCKGEAEDAVRALGFTSLTVVRPSLIGGERDESRPLERLGLLAARAFRPLIPARYRAVQAEDIARCLLATALAAEPGERRVESEAIGACARRRA